MGVSMHKRLGTSPTKQNYFRPLLLGRRNLTTHLSLETFFALRAHAMGDQTAELFRPFVPLPFRLTPSTDYHRAGDGGDADYAGRQAEHSGKDTPLDPLCPLRCRAEFVNYEIALRPPWVNTPWTA